MLPRLGTKYNLKIETVSKPREAYGTEEYRLSGRPKAPALMLGDALLIQGCPIDEETLESAIQNHLNK